MKNGSQNLRNLYNITAVNDSGHCSNRGKVTTMHRMLFF